MGNQDLMAIRNGRMDPEGEGSTSAGRVCGIFAAVIGFLWLVFAGLIELVIQQGWRF
jgi:hypothetical protein